MKLTILGGTGRTGRLVVEQALKAGHDVVVLARSPEKLGLENPRLKSVKGSLAERDKIAQAVAGADAVVSTLGPTSNKASFEISQATTLLVETMKSAGVRRLVITAGAGVGAPGDQPKTVDRVIVRLLKTFNGNVYEDMVRTVDVVKASGLDWTVVRAPRLTDGAATGKVRQGAVGKDIGTQITRADLAGFILASVSDPGAIGTLPAVSN